MIKFGDLIEILEDFCPRGQGFDDDISGVEVNVPHAKVIRKVLVTLDCTTDVVDHAIANQVDLILTHHPFLWGGPIRARRHPRKRDNYERLRTHQIGLFSLHTNYDETYLKQDLAQSLFAPETLNNETKLLTVFDLPQKLPLTQILAQVSAKLPNNQLHYWGDKKKLISRIGIAPGAAGFLIDEVCRQKVDLFICGELKWSNLIKITETELKTIELGHQSEEIFVDLLPVHLTKTLKNKGFQLEFVRYFHGRIKNCYS